MGPFRSIKGKLLLFALCVSLIPIAVITSVYYLSARSTLKRETMDWLTAVAESKKAHVLEFLEAKKGRAIDFSSDGFIRDSLEKISHGEFLNRDEVVSTLNTHLSVNKKPLDTAIAAVAVVNMDGNVVASTSEKWLGDDISDQAIYQQIVKKGYGDTYIDQPSYSPVLGINSIPISAPLTTKAMSENIGVIVNYYDLAALSEIATNRTGLGETGEVYIVDGDGTMLTESRFIDGAPLRQKVYTEPVSKIAEGGAEMAGVYSDYRGVPVVGASRYIPEYGWILLSEMDESEAFTPIRTLGIVVLVVGLVAAAAAAGVGIVFSTSVSRPIKRLTDATRRFAGGDLGARTEVTRRDEIGDLAKSFNAMAQGLEVEITEHKLAEGKLSRTVTDLERSNAELQQFAYVASHDLQEPLRMVASYTQLLARRYKGNLDADADEFIAFAVDGANRMQTLINDLLQYSRVGTRGKPFELTNTKTVLDQTVSNLDVAIKESGAVITHDTLPTVMADATQLTQVFQNLISNAIKFRSKETPRVHVSAKEKENEWVFSVRDNGIGIDPQYFDRIFVIFQRLHGKTEYPGTGIGLAVSKRIVERHEGRIWVESKEGKGSTFYFTIPKR
ncbi:MAG TPA: sensor histidine kinase [Candidatus Avalokitesvara rifleensis]